MITAMIADCGVSVPSVKPSSCRPPWSRFEFSHRCARLCELCINLRMLVSAVATTLGGRLAVKT